MVSVSIPPYVSLCLKPRYPRPANSFQRSQGNSSFSSSSFTRGIISRFTASRTVCLKNSCSSVKEKSRAMGYSFHRMRIADCGMRNSIPKSEIRIPNLNNILLLKLLQLRRAISQETAINLLIVFSESRRKTEHPVN